MPAAYIGAMQRSLATSAFSLLVFFICLLARQSAIGTSRILSDPRAQVPGWSKNDLDFFLHGSMGTEVFPEPVLRAFIKTYPELFPTADFSHLGLIPDHD